MTLSEITYDLLQTLRAGRLSDDEALDIELIEYFIINTRSQLIRQDQSKGRSLSESIVQTLDCTPIVTVSASECCDFPSDCTIIRTKNKIPRPIELYQKDLITRVAGNNMLGKGYAIIPYSRVQWAGSSRWTKDNPKAFYHNGYIYLLNSPVLDSLTISGVFQDPREAAQFANCSGTPCYTPDDNFPLSNWMLPIMKDMIFKMDLRIAGTAPNDMKNDEKNDPSTS